MYYKLIVKNIEIITIKSYISKISKFYIIITKNFNIINNGKFNYLIIYLILKNKDKLLELSKFNNKIIISTTYNKIIHKIFYLYLTPKLTNNIFIDYSFYNLNNISVYSTLSIKYYIQLVKFNSTIKNTIINFFNKINNKLYYIFNSKINYLVFIKNYLLHFDNTIIEINNNINITKQQIKISNSNSIYFILINHTLSKYQSYSHYCKYIYNSLVQSNINFNLLVLSTNN